MVKLLAQAQLTNEEIELELHCFNTKLVFLTLLLYLPGDEKTIVFLGCITTYRFLLPNL